MPRQPLLLPLLLLLNKKPNQFRLQLKRKKPKLKLKNPLHLRQLPLLPLRLKKLPNLLLDLNLKEKIINPKKRKHQSKKNGSLFQKKTKNNNKSD